MDSYFLYSLSNKALSSWKEPKNISLFSVRPFKKVLKLASNLYGAVYINFTAIKYFKFSNFKNGVEGNLENLLVSVISIKA